MFCFFLCQEKKGGDKQYKYTDHNARWIQNRSEHEQTDLNRLFIVCLKVKEKSKKNIKNPEFIFKENILKNSTFIFQISKYDESGFLDLKVNV